MNNTSPLISIVINNYNYSQYLRVCINSALAQTWPNCEVIVVDDGSTDDSRDVIESYSSEITAYYKENEGQGSAYNLGFKQSSGEWIIFLDSDDLLSPVALERSIACIENNVTNIQFYLEIVDRYGKGSGFLFPSQKMHDGNVLPLLKMFRFYNSPPSSGNLYSRKFLSKVLPMPEKEWRISADAYLILAAPVFGEIRSVKEILGYYRRHGESASDGGRNTQLLTAYLRKEYMKEQHRQHYIYKLLVEHLGSSSRDHYVMAPHMIKLRVALYGTDGSKRSLRRMRLILLQVVRTARNWPNYTWLQSVVFCVWCLSVVILPRSISSHLVRMTIKPHERGFMQRWWQWRGSIIK